MLGLQACVTTLTLYILYFKIGMCVWACMYASVCVCVCVVCVWCMCLCVFMRACVRACICVEARVGAWHLHLILKQSHSLHLEFTGSAGLVIVSASHMLGLYRDFTRSCSVVSGVEKFTQVFMLLWQALYQLSHLPSPYSPPLACIFYVFNHKDLF